jgi:hypothetical protein
MAVELQGRRRLRCAGALIALVFVPALAAAQSEAPAISAGYERAYDRFHYVFENPSRFDTPELVPHNFRQTYWGDNQWLFVSARYRVARLLMESTVAATPSQETRGDDVDAFFLPGGDVATSGTSGRIDMRSLRISHDVAVPSKGRVVWHAGYLYRRDRQEFHTRQIKTVTHTLPPSSESFPIDGAETTISGVYEARFGVSRRWAAASGWRLRARVDTAPTTLARLTTILPIKYPGREIVFSALVLTINPSLTIERGERWPIALTISATRTMSYAESRRFDRRAVTAAIAVGRRVSQ